MRFFDHILYILFLAAAVIPAFWGHVIISALICMLVISVFSAKCGAWSLPLPAIIIFAVSYHLYKDINFAIISALVVCAAPFTVGLSIRLNASVTNLLLYSTAILTLSISVGLWYVCHLYNVTVATLLLDRFNEALNTMQSYETNMGTVSPSQIEAVKGMVQAMAMSIPSVLIVSSAAVCFSLTGISRLILEKFSMKSSLPRFYELSLKKTHTYILLAFSIAGYIAGLFSPVIFNVSVICVAILCTCGLSAVDNIFRHSNIPGFVRAIIYIFAFFITSTFFTVILFALGVSDGIRGKRQKNKQ